MFLLPKVNKEIDGFEELKLDDDHSFQILPDQNKEQDCLYVTGVFINILICSINLFMQFIHSFFYMYEWIPDHKHDAPP